MLKTIAIAAGLLIVLAAAVVLLLAARKPDSFRVERAVTIQAPADRVFSLINDLHRWGGWSPYEKKDPSMKRTFSGAASGKGASYGWEGNKQVGQGTMEIIESKPSSLVSLRLDFIKPFEGHNIADFMLTSESPNVTRVTWAMHGPAPLMSKIMQVLFNFDHMIGKDFEDGLATMKALAEKPA